MRVYEYHDVNLRGRIEELRYRTVNAAGESRNKYAHVYLPKGYDAENETQKYNILYLMHGGGGNPDAWLDTCLIKNMLDYAIDTGEIEPLIVVFPSYYKEKIARIGAADASQERINTKLFMKELTDELLPAVEGTLHSYARSAAPDELKAARTHRAFGGFSMGSCTTWYVFIEHLDYFASFLPLSGDCWSIGVMGGKTHPAETAQLIHDAACRSGYKPEDYHIYAATGTGDPAAQALGPQVEEMKKHSDAFVFDEDYAKGNFHYLLAEGQTHCYPAVCQYLYNYLPFLFQF